MNQNTDLVAIYDCEYRQKADWTRMDRENFANLVRYTAHEKKRGAFISWFDLDESNADAEIEKQMAHYRALGIDLEWKVCAHDGPADMGQRLLRHGFTLTNDDSVMLLDLAQVADSFWAQSTNCVSRISTAAGIDDIMQMEKEIWHKDFTQLGEGMKMDLRDQPDHISLFAVYADGRCVSAAWTHYLSPTLFGILLGGSTLPAYRGRGFYTALIAARGLEARTRGFRYLTLDASAMSRPILEKHGFSCIDTSQEYEIKFFQKETQG